jgi:hypothetical protein
MWQHYLHIVGFWYDNVHIYTVPYEDVWAEISDDTKELEKWPLKNPFLPWVLQILDTHKQPHLSPEYPEDYTEDQQKE